jgi:PAS domain S-box-containing protein
MSKENKGLTELGAEQYRALIKETSDVISIIDEDGTVCYQSPSSEAVKGWSRTALLGENILDYIHPEDKGRVEEAFEVLSSNKEYNGEVEFRLQTKDGDWLWLATTGTAPEVDSPIDGFVTTSRNITERKRTEQELKSQRDDLELLNQVVRHDIRNDLQVVSAHAELLEDHVDAEGQEHLDQLKESNEQAAELTITARDLTDVILRSESDLEPTLLEPVVEQQISELESSHTDATFTVDDSIEGKTIRADDMLGTVFTNLLKNAVQHSDKEHAEVTITANLSADTVEVRVSDNGPGIPDSQKETVFGKEEKGLESSGTGIGLYLVHEIVTGYGGEVWVEDRTDADGAVFVIDFPSAE